jgi:hypothetical protein
MAISKNEKLVFLKKGKVIEENFIKLFNNAASTTEEEDINNHVDIKVHVGIDVKGLKKVNRSDQETNEHIHWVELKNVNGKAGWLYGDADFFSFEIKDYWLVVDKVDLQRFIAEKCREKIRVSKPELYKLYQRKDRKDIITLVSSYDLCYICTKQIKKNKL